MSPTPFEELVKTVHRLRAPGGCPWDREQTHPSLRPYLLEETYEALEVLDRFEPSRPLTEQPDVADALREELGDVWLQVLLHAEIAREAGAFDIDAIARSLNTKLIARHPHVFGSEAAATSEAVLQNWEARKLAERTARAQARGGQAASVLDGLPTALPALNRAARLIDKVSRLGFRWPDVSGALEKVREELRELEQALTTASARQLSEELGDVLFSICNVASYLKVNPEDALREATQKFERRFRGVEQRLAARGGSFKNSSLAELDALWDEAKRAERGPSSA